MSAKKNTEPGYREATEEIDAILNRIEDSREIDVDALADDVERAAELLQICGDRLKKAELRVQEVAERLVSEDEANDPDAESENP
ncbi:MAG: exodeoxyribonuclease VII small subunit [Planctomycetia bacterium]|nr:exodeoxyribonuclease VII small subunit [Planctomycetia bacterium]MBL6915370.1 exodeoxyribonuclease VII small subunit [Planctomycetota bacterium]MDC0347168.1 exodeoxyribonuclease VII small subunit [Planctomycetota bacterium]MDC0852987.1 exodeoxyribonuclease VII small subunit [Planctomycetota bacterium]MDG2083920.1 exodeoxyribonuclease VII small subunit [Planctomycetota bacterium]